MDTQPTAPVGGLGSFMLAFPRLRAGGQQGCDWTSGVCPFGCLGWARGGQLCSLACGSPPGRAPCPPKERPGALAPALWRSLIKPAANNSGGRRL